MSPQGSFKLQACLGECSNARPVCVQGMAKLTRLIFERAQPKRLGSQVITGPMLATLASEYVRAINEGAVPTISTAWQVRPSLASSQNLSCCWPYRSELSSSRAALLLPPEATFTYTDHGTGVDPWRDRCHEAGG